MVYPVVKIATLEDISRIDFFSVNPAIYEICIREYKYEILVNAKRNHDKAVVFGTGDINRDSKPLPCFDRHSWANEIDATCIYYSDPTLYKTEQTGLCWCYGDNSDWCLKTIALLINKILKNLSITLDKTLFFGSSGGGFTAIALATILRGKATVINPQFIVRNFWERKFNLFKKIVNCDDTNLIESHVDIAELIMDEKYLPPIHLIINSGSKRDIETQYKPFMMKMKQNGFQIPLYKVTEYYNENGHGGMPSKEYCISIIHNDLNNIRRESKMGNNGNKKLYLVFTIDTEDKYSSAPNMIECDFGDIGNCGVNYIMGQFEKRGMKGVFFVNIYEHCNYKDEYEDYMPQLLRKINDRGHEIGLHTHQCSKLKEYFPDQLYSCDYMQQKKAIKYGMDYIKKYISKYPVSHRGGAYGCNEITFEVLQEMGIRIDSSSFYAYPGSYGNRFVNYYGFNLIHKIGNIDEFPVINILNNNGAIKKFDINSITENEVIQILEQMKSRKGFDVAQIMFHSFSFLDQKGNGESKPFWTSGSHNAYGISQSLTQRFETILDYVQNDPDIEVITFEEYLNMNLSEPDFWSDGLFYCDTEVSKKAAIQFSVDRFNQRALLPTTYNESNKPIFRYDYTYNYQSKYFPDNTIIELADKIINGELIVYGKIAPLKFSIEKFNWNIRYSNIPNTFQLYLQAFNFLQILVRAYELVRNAKYLQKGYELIKSWRNFYTNDENKLSNKYVYCDHSVALRTENLLYFAKTCNSHAFWGKEMFDLIESILFENGNWLSNEKNYSKAHNHGIMQDKALLQLGFCMQNTNWIELAKKRLEEQKNAAFNEEYVHVENSPSYAQLVRKIFLELADFLESNNDEFGKLLRNDMEKVQEYINWTIKPNGIVAQVGDSTNPVGVLYADKAKQKRHTEDIHAIYPVTGQYFYRYSFDESPQNDTWKFIKSGYTSTTHKHADDLSFMLYSRGYEIFTDSGIYGYVKNVYRRYFTSALAHNSIIVDNQSYDVKNENSRFFGLSEYELSEYFDRVTLFNNAYNGVKIQRDFCSCGDLTVIYDFIESSDYHVYSQLFHLAENISVVDSSDTHVRLKIGDSGYYADIIQLGDPCRAYVINGNLSIPQYGLLSRAENHLEVSTTIKFDTISETGLFVTVIAITDSNGKIQLSHDESCNIDDLHFDANNVCMQTPQRCIESSFSKINLDETVLETNTVLTDKKIKFNLKIRKPYIGRLRFAYYLYKEDEVIEKRMYDSSEEQLFNIKGNGSYRVKYFLSDGNQKKSYWGETIKIKL